MNFKKLLKQQETAKAAVNNNVATTEEFIKSVEELKIKITEY